jgi:hypothetical protein
MRVHNTTAWLLVHRSCPMKHTCECVAACPGARTGSTLPCLLQGSTSPSLLPLIVCIQGGAPVEGRALVPHLLPDGARRDCRAASSLAPAHTAHRLQVPSQQRVHGEHVESYNMCDEGRGGVWTTSTSQGIHTICSQPCRYAPVFLDQFMPLLVWLSVLNRDDSKHVLVLVGRRRLVAWMTPQSSRWCVTHWQTSASTTPCRCVWSVDYPMQVCGGC